MTQAIIMPKLGLTMTEGMVSEWLVKPGDSVRQGDILFVVETDKIANEIEAERDGTIGAIRVEAGSSADVGAVLATYKGDAAAPAAPSKGASASPAPSDSLASAPSDGLAPASPASRIFATPLARRIAGQRGIDLAEVSGSGPRGRIVTADLPADVAVPMKGTDSAIAGRGSMQAMSTNQRTTARRLTQAKREIPHFYIHDVVDVRALEHLRGALNTASTGPRLSLNHFILVALVRAITAHPEMNRIWAEDAFEIFGTIDVGMAVETDQGLVAPVLHDLGTLHIDAIAAKATDTIERARQGRLRREDLSGGSITISNVGMFGVAGVTPIINPGQAAILGVGAVKPVFRPGADGSPELRDEIALALACDHRVINGGDAARFMATLRSNLENPLSLVREPR